MHCLNNKANLQSLFTDTLETLGSIGRQSEREKEDDEHLINANPTIINIELYEPNDGMIKNIFLNAFCCICMSILNVHKHQNGLEWSDANEFQVVEKF